MYKVFLVEDEIVTREGIRDNVDWASVGFTFCGEAPDGEMALPLIEETQPDVLITDIKMPFMDGLQLSKIIREHMPWMKIIILSGHDEFEYAQSAVKLGVTEYLLKPISAGDLHQVMKSLALTLDQEKQEREELKQLQNNAEDNLVLSRERFLLKLVMGGISSAEAIEQSQQLGLELVAKHYLVVMLRVERGDNSQPIDFRTCQRIEKDVAKLVGNHADVLLTKRNPEELILLFKGNDIEQLLQEGLFFARLVRDEVESQIPCNIVIEVGSQQSRLGDIHHSYSAALVNSKATPTSSPLSEIDPELVEALTSVRAAIDNYLKFGSAQDFESFFSTTLQPLARIALQSDLMKHYLLVDIILTLTQFTSELGGDVQEMSADVHEIGAILNNMRSMEHIKEELKSIFFSTISYRNNLSMDERRKILHQARDYVDANFTDPDLQMNKVADEFSISPSHFSVIFSQEFGENFRDYLSNLRINCAKELLCTTNLKIASIANQSGFNDPQYFSVTFKKKTGFTPQQFRTYSRKQAEVG